MSGNRRRIRKKTAAWKTAAFFLALMVIAVGVGCFSAKYMVAPWLFEQPEATASKAGTDSARGADAPNVISDGQTVKETGTVPAGKENDAPSDTKAENDEQGGAGGTAGPSTVYTIQYGSFSTEAAAVQETVRLKAIGIETRVLSQGQSFKVVEKPFAGEAEARAALEARRSAAGADLFITTMEADQS